MGALIIRSVVSEILRKHLARIQGFLVYKDGRAGTIRKDDGALACHGHGPELGDSIPVLS